MHTLDKIKFKSFDGAVDIHGTDRDVTFMSADGDEPSVLIIRGLKLEDALHVLDRLRGGLLKEADLPSAAPEAKPQPKVEAKGPIDFAKRAKEAKAAKEVKIVPAPEPEQLTLPHTKEEVVEDEDDDMGEDAEPGELDVVAMSKMEKLREVIEYMVEAGHNTADKIVEVSRRFKNDVPLLRLVEEKGGFDKRMERNALVVLAGRPTN